VLPLDRPLLDYIAIGAAALAVLTFLLVLATRVRLRRLRRDFAVLEGPDGSAETFLSAVNRHAAEVTRLRAETGQAREQLGFARQELASALRHVGVVRYDAFGDMGGQLSFSVALVDDAGDGVVLTSINGRSETRSYAKPLSAAQSPFALSPEETDAIAQATGPVRPTRSSNGARHAAARRDAEPSAAAG
jgi:hypothetical protein